MEISDNGILNDLVSELYFYGNSDKLTQIRNQNICTILEYQANDIIYTGFCLGDTWNNNTCFAAATISLESFLKSAVIHLTPRNNSSVYGSIITAFKQSAWINGFRLKDECFDIKNWPVIYDEYNNGAIYCSSSEGNLINTGSREYPMNSIAEALRRGKNIRLKRGDIFYEYVSLEGHNIDAYGSGNTPVISGLRKIESKSAWQRGKVNGSVWLPDSNGSIWRIHLAGSESWFSGMPVSGSSLRNNIGGIVDTRSNRLLNCCRVKNITDLQSDYDFFQPYIDGATSDFDYLYMYLGSDPNDLELGVTSGANGITACDSHIENVIVCNWGRHGISCMNNTTVRNVEIFNVGGMIQIGYSSWACLGNGVEYYITDSNYKNGLVEFCNIHNCFDAALTIQGSSSINSLTAKNILFQKNRVSHCCQGFEDFLRDKNRTALFENCILQNNIFVDMGMNTGFRYYDGRFKYCALLNNSGRNTRMMILNNRFINGNFRCTSICPDGKYESQILNGNICFIVRGQFLLSNYNGSAAVIRIPLSDSYEGETEAAIEHYRSLTNDYSTEFFIFESQKDINRYIALRLLG